MAVGLQGLEGVIPLAQGLLQGSYKLGDLHAGGGGMLQDGVKLIPGVLGVPACWCQPVLHRTTREVVNGISLSSIRQTRDTVAVVNAENAGKAGEIMKVS